jgi:hypothetical protein
MFMDMDFPHPRNAKQAGEKHADYSALIASAISRQASSKTVGAMLTSAGAVADGRDFIGRRIAFFGQSAADAKQRNVFGAFWNVGDDTPRGAAAKFELPVNPDGSTKGNSKEQLCVTPEKQETPWGTEL